LADTVDISSLKSLTPAPTNHPTAYPTLGGYAMVEKQVEVAVVSAALSFSLSQDEASNLLIRASLEAGFANAIGLSADKVGITHIDGVSLKRRLSLPKRAVYINDRGDGGGGGGGGNLATGSRRMRVRRKLGSVDVTFDIESASASPEQVQALKVSAPASETSSRLLPYLHLSVACCSWDRTQGYCGGSSRGGLGRG
jgi:hypothetical protein